VYRHAAVPLTWQGRLVAAVLAAGDGALGSHRSAARAFALRDVPRWRPELTVEATDLPRVAGVTIHRTNRLDPPDRTIVDGMPVTSLPRTLLDLGAVLPYEIVEQAAHDAVIRKLVTFESLVAVVDRLGGRGRRGVGVLRAVLLGAALDERLESELERRLVALAPKSPHIELQHRMTCVDGRVVRLDVARRDRRIAVEGNGDRWQTTPKDARRDRERRRSIQASGWDHYEYGWSEVTETPELVRAELAVLLG